MRIALITPTYFPTRGGTEQVVHEIAVRLAKKHKIDIITPGTGNEEHENLRVIRFPQAKTPILGAIKEQLRLYPLLKKLHKKENYNLIHQFHVYQLGGAVTRFARKHNVPLITTLAGWDTYDPHRPVPKILHKYMAHVMNYSKIVTTMSEHMIVSARKQGCKQITKIPHGTSLFGAASGIVNIREKYNLPNGKIILSLQRLAKRKGLELLIEAARTINATFLICGKGPLREELEKKAKELGVQDKVIFAGFVPDNEIKDHYLQADLFCLPSFYEAFGLVYVDALACGLPVITTKCGGPEDFITPRNGILMPTGDSGLLSEALKEGLAKKWDREEIAKDAEQFSWDSIVEQYETLYHTLNISFKHNFNF